MIPDLKITNKLLDKITLSKEPISGKLHGILCENSIYLIAAQTDLSNEIPLEISLPSEIDCFGLFSTDTEINSSDILKKLKHNSNDFIVTDNPIFISYNIEFDKLIAYFLINEKLEEKQISTVTEDEVYKQFLYVRLRGNLTINCQMTKESCMAEFSKLETMATSGKLAFNISKTPVYLLGIENKLNNKMTGFDGEANVGGIYSHFNKTDDICNKMFDPTSVAVLDVDLLLKTSQSGENDHSVCMFIKKNKKTANIPINIDAISIVSAKSSLDRLYEILVGSVIKSLVLFERALVANIAEDEECSSIILPEVYHFFPVACGHFISIWINKDADQVKLAPTRQLLHKAFMLPSNRPLFKKENTYPFNSSKSSKGPLTNVHENVKNTNNGGTIALVKGRYDYYHYCQNSMNDNGWGCAYRSLQTLASWFKRQGYTAREVPTFEEIQKCLVDIGDKPSNFIGSRQWIGSTEVSFVLDTLLGVSCRIVYVSNGSEMAYQGPELMRHFQIHGTPVMIGGGQLAHTILGVDYNQETDDLKFLILDPHYTGSEDVKTIVNKGWCAWKGVEFWNKSSYYNMCLPMVPHGV